MKKIALAFDSFKESLTSLEIAHAVEKGIKEILPQVEIIKIPMADGGEGTTETMLFALNGKKTYVSVADPLYRKREAYYAQSHDKQTAFIEMAQASGLELLPLEERNPLYTTTYGTGEMIIHALEQGCRSLIIGIGGSATNDGGMGMLAALGVQFLDANNKVLEPHGANLIHIEHIDNTNIHPLVQEATFRICCDVNNPLYGEQGAAYIFGPQKGASPAIVKELDEGLRHYAKVVYDTWGIDLSTLAGAGAAGGLGGGFVVLGASLEPGEQLITEILHLKERLQGVDCVFTGEGRLDYQSRFGKTPTIVAKEAKAAKVPLVIALCGSLGKDFEEVHECGIDSCFSILTNILTLEEALSPAQTAKSLTESTRQIMRLLMRK